jgi:antitoxin (DNA-binding transcriptional repressor) of toxin-antitoxin stability system
VSSSSNGTPIARVGDDLALVFTTHELGQQAARLVSEIQKAGRPAVITEHGRFIATITPLMSGQVESQVLPEMARQIEKTSHG